MDRAQTDRAEHVSRLYKELGPVIYARCRRLLGDASQAEDATQEVFVRAFTHLEPALPEGEALAWLQRISTNLCLDALRKRKRHAESSGVPEDVRCDEPSPEAQVVNRQLLKKIAQGAPSSALAPALMYHLDGLDQATIARKLQLSRRTVITRIQAFASRAREVAA